MDQTQLIAHLKKVTARASDEDIALAASCAKWRELKKGEVLLKQGQVCREFYLVERGYLRTYHSKDEAVININFTFEGEYYTNGTSLFSRTPSDQTIEAGEQSHVWIFNLDDMALRNRVDSSLLLFFRRVAVRILLVAEEQSNLFKTKTPTERYRYVEEHNPKLLQRISLSQIASYLGVTRETLSRIRAKRD